MTFKQAIRYLWAALLQRERPAIAPKLKLWDDSKLEATHKICKYCGGSGIIPLQEDHSKRTMEDIPIPTGSRVIVIRSVGYLVESFTICTPGESRAVLQVSSDLRYMVGAEFVLGDNNFRIVSVQGIDGPYLRAEIRFLKA